MEVKTFFIWLAILGVLGCQQNQKQKPKEGETLVASFGNEFLYLSNIALVQDKSLSQSDSINLLNAYRDNWLKEKLVLEQAKLQLGARDRREIEAEVKAFENENYKYRYEKKFIQQRFDTMNLVADIDTFYKKNIESYKLKQPVVRFILISKSARLSEDSIKKWAVVPEHHYKIEDLCSELLIQCHLETFKWLKLSSLSRILNISEIELTQQLKEQELVLLETDQGEFFCYVLEWKKEGDTTPLSLVKDDIRTLVVNQRKIAFIGNLRNELYEEALQKGKIEIY